MLGRYKKQVMEAEGRRQQAATKLAKANQRWDYQKKCFFNNPVNLLLPFTAGALLASRGSATKQVVNWSRVIATSGKFLIAAYPLFRKVRRKAAIIEASTQKETQPPEL